MALKPPSGLDSAGRSAWRRAVLVVERLGDDPELCGETLHAYAVACSRVVRLRREWMQAGGSAIREGPRGGVYPDPVLGSIEKAERWAFELGASLGLDPISRHRLGRSVRGRPQGATSAADRQKIVQMPQRRTPKHS
jgi:phage terminase small subunit